MLVTLVTNYGLGALSGDIWFKALVTSLKLNSTKKAVFM